MTFALENNNNFTFIAKYVNHSHRINNQIIPYYTLSTRTYYFFSAAEKTQIRYTKFGILSGCKDELN